MGEPLLFATLILYFRGSASCGKFRIVLVMCIMCNVCIFFGLCAYNFIYNKLLSDLVIFEDRIERFFLHQTTIVSNQL